MKRKDIFYKTKKNIIIISVTIVFLCLFIFTVITKTLYSSRLFNDVDRQLLQQRDMLERISPNSINSNEGNILDEKGPSKSPRIPPNIIVIVYEKGNIDFISPNAYFNTTSLPDLAKIEKNKISVIEHNGYTFRCTSFDNKQYNMQVFINVNSELKSMKQLTNAIVISLIVLIIIAIILSAYLASRIIKPVREAYNKQVFFVQDASHEMRTPLAVIKGKLELLANSWGDTIDTHFEHISKMMSEVRSLEKLNSDLLLLSKEDVDSSINITEVNLNDFIEDLSDFYGDLADMQGKKFYVKKTKDNIKLQWDYNKIRRATIILIENAFKYTSSKGEITLTFEDINKSILIRVKDNGIGIKDEDKNRIFDRFFRSSDVRGKNINGSGIGLSLLKSICKTLGIGIKVGSQYGKGTEFILNVPKVMK